MPLIRTSTRTHTPPHTIAEQRKEGSQTRQHRAARFQVHPTTRGDDTRMQHALIFPPRPQAPSALRAAARLVEQGRTAARQEETGAQRDPHRLHVVQVIGRKRVGDAEIDTGHTLTRLRDSPHVHKMEKAECQQ